MSGDGRQPLVDDPDRHGCDRGSDGLRVRESCVRCGTAGAIHRQWQADHDFDGTALDDKRRDSAQIVASDGPVVTTPHCLDRGSQHRARIARRHPDADAAHINPQPNPWSKLPKLPNIGAGHDGRRLAHALATRC
jgi:hypothetical protein